jgi:hypothetical protein
LSFITLWHLTFVNVFHPLPYDLFPWVSLYGLGEHELL